jgi:hypothetical protein
MSPKIQERVMSAPKRVDVKVIDGLLESPSL